MGMMNNIFVYYKDARLLTVKTTRNPHLVVLAIENLATKVKELKGKNV